MSNRTIKDLEARQEDGRGALTCGAWLYIERDRDGGFLVETSALSNAADVRAALAPYGFAYCSKTGRYRARISSGELSLRRVGAAGLKFLAEEIPPLEQERG
mgnify:CR=1 FL=1